MKKNLLITGSGKRIGANTAISMAKMGWNVAICYNVSENSANETANIIKNLGKKICVLKANLENPQEISNLFDLANREIGTINCLINNAALFKNDQAKNITGQLLEQHLKINLIAPILLAQKFYQQLNGENGNVINFLDYCIAKNPSNFFSYTLSKSALKDATILLAKQLSPNIRVNALALGNVMKGDQETEEHYKKSKNSSLLGKETKLTDINKAIKLILETSSITGQVIYLDNGKHLADGAIY